MPGGNDHIQTRYWPTVLVPASLSRARANEALRAQSEPPAADVKGNHEEPIEDVDVDDELTDVDGLERR